MKSDRFNQLYTDLTWLISNLLIVKKVSVKVYVDEIGCYERPEECKSEFMCNAKGGGNYVEAAFNSSGITDKQFILNVAP